MDDLLGEDWQAPAKTTNNASFNNTPSFASTYSSLRASPLPTSGTASPQPLSRPSSTVNNTAKSTGDSFGKLLGNRAQKQDSSTLSIQERQKQLIEEKRRQQEQQRHQWDSLGSGRATPEVRGPSPALPQPKDDGDDILAAFSKDAPVNRASHLPTPLSSTAPSGRNTPVVIQSQQAQSMGSAQFDDHDDPFGLGAAPSRATGHTRAPVQQKNGDDDDILGDLSRPVDQRPLANNTDTVLHHVDRDHDVEVIRKSANQAPQDGALAELVDMGFPVDSAKIALAESNDDVQAAVGYLLQEAHEESKQKARAEAQTTRQRSPVHGSRSPQRRPRGEQDRGPAWAQEEDRASSTVRRQDSRSPANGDKDASQVAQELGSKLFKGANSLWKASQKQMAKTVAEFQQERDASQPKWMQDATPAASRATSQTRQPQRKPPTSRAPVDVTDEAAMLDMPREPQAQTITRQPRGERVNEHPRVEDESPNDIPRRPSPLSNMVLKPAAQPDKRPVSKLNRQDIEEQTALAYISPARRKRPTPQPQPQPTPEVDLFSPVPAQAISNIPSAFVAASNTPASRPSPAPLRPAAPPRNIPAIPSSALASSAQHRKAGGEAFKRGDYSAAHESYTAALSPLPGKHPIAIIVLTNRALTGLKTGDAKTAVSDADRALDIIGAGLGVGETIDVGSGESPRDMRDFYGKALMRKAEALEHMEKWNDGAAVWRLAVQNGVGGAVSLQGRDRCEKAAQPKVASAPLSNGTATKPTARKAPPAKSLGNSLQRPSLPSPSSAAAVRNLRAANAAAEKADDEKFALIDSVDARLTAWKGSKADNLRALLQSLDSVLWEGAGWKKVGMSDLVVPGKVKVVYMRAIGRVHPDKIPQDATTEQRMVSAAVFSTLNEAWDKFKTDNGL
ncbi:hypothetical protein LTR62_001695 [Meristemomyces frigidus]|uniref:UBA domain-containing protein n=1 Tax=Meristemomyces frigidus TaxID=1508187 RepID=A0AAN7TFI3_9PEZI|nr:hypothetical protein LTR62_001695 [Meristemomyces frigidus]